MGGMAKIGCDYCGRPPGGVHDDECPHSRASQRALRQQIALLSEPRVIWSFGVQSVRTPTGNAISFNPNVPYVNPAGGKPWNAGGCPADAAEKAEAFKNALQLAAIGVR